jgi:hypothetical protein
LDAVARIRHRVLVGDLGDAQALHADTEPGAVHHHEHRIQALVRLTHQPAYRPIEDDLAGRVAVDAHLFLDAGAVQSVALADRGSGTTADRQELRHDE